MKDPIQNRPDYIKSLEKGLKVIHCFADAGSSLTLSDVAARIGITRAAARRFLLTLTELGYTRMNGRNFALTPKILSLSGSYLASDTLPDVATPFLKELTDKVRESSSLSILDGGDIVYVARSHTQRIMSLNIQIGTRLPAWCTAMGRAQLAYLDKDRQRAIIDGSELIKHTPKTLTSPKQLMAELAHVQEQGYALVDQQLEIGVISIAVPVFSRQQQVIAAANVAAHASRVDIDQLVGKILPVLREAVSGIQVAYHP
jgi:IclR family pca regulon transcriptional regulator